MAGVAIAGCGLVGRAWAISFARAGHAVALWDIDPAAPGKARDYIAGILPELGRQDLLDGQTPDVVHGRVRIAVELEDALDGVVHVQENVPERIDLKRALFVRLDALAPAEAILASSTSAILPSLFTADLRGRARCVVVHPLNPPYLIPAVEVVPAPWTSPETVARTRDFLAATGHAPIVMERELDGFVMNRLQGALLEEAFRLVAEGYASVEDVDVGLREGLALRWSFMGPFETIDLNAPGGVRDYVERYRGIYERLFGDRPKRTDWTGPVLADIETQRRLRLPAQDLEKRQVWRDRRLMALAAHKRKAKSEIGE